MQPRVAAMPPQLPDVSRHSEARCLLLLWRSLAHISLLLFFFTPPLEAGAANTTRDVVTLTVASRRRVSARKRFDAQMPPLADAGAKSVAAEARGCASAARV